MDTHKFYPILGQLRYQYQIGLKLIQAVKSGSSLEELAKAFPQMLPKNLQKYYGALPKFSENYFTKACSLLFDYELEAKISVCSLKLLWVKLLVSLKSLEKK